MLAPPARYLRSRRIPASRSHGLNSARLGPVACAIWLFCLLWSGLPASAAALTSTARAPASRLDTATIQRLVNDLKTQLSISEEVRIAIVAENPLMVSIRRVGPRDGPFEMVFESRFVGALEPGDLKAVIAHELGHVWIFTHHPFLQTEQLANEIAMRVVSRESLETVYDKVWKRSGVKGDLAEFLGSK